VSRREGEQATEKKGGKGEKAFSGEDGHSSSDDADKSESEGEDGRVAKDHSSLQAENVNQKRKRKTAEKDEPTTIRTQQRSRKRLKRRRMRCSQLRRHVKRLKTQYSQRYFVSSALPPRRQGKKGKSSHAGRRSSNAADQAAGDARRLPAGTGRARSGTLNGSSRGGGVRDERRSGTRDGRDG
jgi:hypothetical protein